MRIVRMARAAALVALFAALPAPASAQLGFIKKQLKQKIVQEVVDSALSKVAGQDDSAKAAPAAAAGAQDTTARPQGASAAAASGIGGFLKKRLGSKLGHAADTAQSHGTGQPAGAEQAAPRAGTGKPTAAAGPQFDEFVVEITPQSLGQLEKYLATQSAQRNEGEHQAGNIATAFARTDQLSTVRFSLMTQRVVAYCAATQPGETAAAMSMYGGGANELQKSFTPAEIKVLRPRCPSLMALLKKES